MVSKRLIESALETTSGVTDIDADEDVNAGHGAQVAVSMDPDIVADAVENVVLQSPSVFHSVPVLVVSQAGIRLKTATERQHKKQTAHKM